MRMCIKNGVATITRRNAILEFGLLRHGTLNTPSAARVGN
jgi:hypothetical protein